MASEHLWIAPGDIETDISGRVQLPKPGEDGFRLHTQAVEGSVGSSDILLDDEAGGFYVTGLNAYRVRETLSEADDPYIFAGHFGRRKESRNGVYQTGPSRQIFAQVQDANALLSRYVIREGEDGDRPQETDTARWEWLRASGIFPAESDFDDTLFIIDPAGVTLSAADLQDYTAQQIIDDMAQQSGRNYYVYFDGVEEKYLVVYADDGDTHLTSDLRFSNVESDHDGVTTFARNVGSDWELDISPERLASTVIVRYANGSTGETDDDTAAEFSRVDRVMDANLVKTSGVALARAIKYLNELDSEELELTGTVYLPASKASQFRAGMRCEMKASHLTGMSDFVWVRLHEVTIVNIAEDPTLTYALAFTGVFDTHVSGCGAVIGALNVQYAGQHNFGGIDFGPVTGDAITGSGDDTLTLSLFVTTSGEVSLHSVSVDSPWVAGAEKPGDVGGSHTETLLAYHAGTVATPEWDWTNYTYLWQQFSVVIPTAATEWGGEAVVDGLGDITSWDSAPSSGDLLFLARVAEGPTGWAGNPTGAEWTKIADEDQSGGVFGNTEIWVACCPDDIGDLNTGNAGSSWWAHLVWVSIE